MKHLVHISAQKPALASVGLATLLLNTINLMGTLLVRQRQSAWKTPFPQIIFDPDDTTDTGTGGGDGDAEA